MLLVTVLLVAASCSVAIAGSPKKSAFDASSRGNEYITQSSLYSSVGESQRISRKHRPSQGSIQSSSYFLPPYEDQQYYDPLTQPLRAQRRSRKYITSDKIRSKQNKVTQLQRVRKTSKDYSREYFSVNRKQKNSNEYLPVSSDQDNTNQYDQVYQSIDDWKQDNLNKADGSAKLIRPEDFSRFESQYSVPKENGFDQSADYSLNYDRMITEQPKKSKATTKFYQYDENDQSDSQNQNANKHLIDTYLNYNPIKEKPKQIKESYKFSQSEYYGGHEHSYSTPKASDQLTNSYENYNPYHDQLRNEKASTSFSPPENQYSDLKPNAFDQSAGSLGNFNPVQEQSPLKIGKIPTKYSQPEDLSQFIGYSDQIPRDKSSDTFGKKNPIKNTVYLQDTFLPLTEIKSASPQYIPPAETKDYYLPSQVDVPTTEYLTSKVKKPYEQYLPSRVNDPAEEFQPIKAVAPPKHPAPPTIDKESGVNNNTPLSYSDAFFSNSYVTSEKPEQKFEYLPPSENQLPSENVPSANNDFNSNLTKNFNDNDTREHYNNFKGRETPIYVEPEVITTSNHFTPEHDKVIPSSYLPQIEQPVFQGYTSDHNYDNQPELMSNSTADRRNDISSTIQSNPTHSFMFSQKKPTVALRPIKRFNYGNTPFQHTPYPIDRSSLDQNPLKLDSLNSNFVSQSSFFDPANSPNHFSQSGQSMQFGSKLPQQGFNGNKVYASSRSSNVPSPIQQIDLPYETSTHGLNSNTNNNAPNSINNLRQPIELILPNQSQILQQQANSYASNFAHHSYSQEATTEDVPILKQTNEIAYDGSFHYETLTGDQTHVIQEGHIENPGTDNEEQVIHGSYSFLGSDGITYTINYVADANGFRAIGDHLPTPPPVPEVIQRSIDMNIAAEANKAAQNFHFEQSSLSLADELNRAGQENSYDLTRRNYNIDSRNRFKNYHNSLSRNLKNYKNSSKIHQTHNYDDPQNEKLRNQGSSHSIKGVSQPRHSGQNNLKSGIINIQNTPSPKLDANRNQPLRSLSPSNLGYSNQIPQSTSNYNFQSYKSPETVSNDNHQSYQMPRSISNNDVQIYENPQSITNNDVQSYQTPQTISNNDVQSYQTPQSIGFDDVQAYQTPQSVSYDNVQTFQTPKSIINSNYQSYQTPQSIIFNNDQSYEPPQAVNNLQNDQNNFHDYLLPQYLKIEKTNDPQTSQAGYDNHVQSYETAQTDNEISIQSNQDSNYGTKINIQENQNPTNNNQNNIQNHQMERRSDIDRYENKYSYNNYPEGYQIQGTNQNFDQSYSNPKSVSSKSQDFQNNPTNFNNVNKNNDNYPIAMDKGDSFYEIDASNPYPEIFKIILPDERSYSNPENNVHRSIAETRGK